MKKHTLLASVAAVLTLAACSVPAARDIDVDEYLAQHTSAPEEVKDVLGTVTDAWGKKPQETTMPETTVPETTAKPEPPSLTDEELSALDNKEVGYGQGVQFDENNRPAGSKDFNTLYAQYDAYALFDSDDQICLTFDQGYENGYTGQILDTLKEKEVKAIFFLTGDYVRNTDPALIQRMIDEGHVLGNHGDRHRSLAELMNTSILAAEAELADCQTLVKEKFGYDMKYMRPPEGVYSERSLALAQRMGYTTLMYSFAYKDWERNNQPNADEAFTKITAHPHGGEFMLLHAVSSTNASILDKVIDELRAQGFTLTIPEI